MKIENRAKVGSLKLISMSFKVSDKLNVKTCDLNNKLRHWVGTGEFCALKTLRSEHFIET